jgi:hypothetical protein
MTLTVAFAPAAADGTNWGGTLTLTSNAHFVHKNVKTCLPHITRVEVEWSGRLLELASVYLPQSPLARVNVLVGMDAHMSDSTLVGGDFNVVPDVTLDVQSSNPLNYSNQGAALLAQHMTSHGLVDERREQLGTEKEPTREEGGTSTRIDRWYVPTAAVFDDILWSFEISDTFIFKKPTSDHSAVLLTMEDATGDLGHERQTVNESLLYREDIQDRVIEISDGAFEGNATFANKWERSNKRIAHYLKQETAKARKKDGPEVKRLLLQLKIIKSALRRAAGQRIGALAARRKACQNRLYDLKYPEHRIPSADQAHNMAQRSEKCTREQFIPYKAAAKRQWINELHEADWEEGKQPTITGKTKTTQDVPNQLMKYYKMLFQNKQISANKMNLLIGKLKTKRILEESAARLEEAISRKEVQNTMENLPMGKQAGPNRVPNGVYKLMASHFAPKFEKVLAEVLTSGRIPRTFLEGDISTLYKKADRLDPRNYRPITLLNTDYKIYTRILAKRMCGVVHEFVSEAQKGFVPHTFIAEATILLRNVEAYINEEGMDRQGALLFLDMEKAFDRVSYEFLNKGLDALGFGENYKKRVAMMYNVQDPPNRRIYANGYYSDSFDINSGVAQGCPLSPLLFLIVAEALKISLELEPQLRGIKIGKRRYLIVQFADDTTVMIRGPKDMKAVNRAIKRWCDATGMKENMTKREGLKMGRLRTRRMDPTVAWAKEGEAVKSLGVPIGNDFDEAKWWKRKIEAVRDVAQKWVGLYRQTYFGRNLVVQAMYFGRLRYWLYSLHMPKEIVEMVQRDADTLWWAREPDLHQTRRIRRWVAQRSAIGPRNKGGLNVMNWSDHVDSFYAQWFVRYLHPGNSSWKDLVDHILLHNPGTGELIYPEGRGILLANLTPAEKNRMIARIPAKATYLRACLRAFWKLGLTPEKPDSNLDSQFFWHNWRFNTPATHHTKKYFKEEQQVVRCQDVIDDAVNYPFDGMDWRNFVEATETQKRGHAPPNEWIIRKANDMGRAMRHISRRIARKLEKRPAHDPKPGEYIWMEREGHEPLVAKYRESQPKYELQWVDTVGIPHGTGQYRDYRMRTPHALTTWGAKTDLRIVGPIETTFPQNTRWEIAGKPLHLHQLTIKKMTKAKTGQKVRTPACQDAWNARLRPPPLKPLPWGRIWKLKSYYATPRDEVTWLKLIHRNLYVANRDKTLPNCTCSARGCQQDESMIHLAECDKIRRNFWDRILTDMQDLGMPRPENTRTFLITGLVDEKAAGQDQAGILMIAWRCLYAEVVKARLEGGNLNFDNAYRRVIEMTISRLQAYGTKWRRWYMSIRKTSKAQPFPEKHRTRILMKFEADAKHEVSDKLLDIRKKAREDAGIDTGNYYLRLSTKNRRERW